MGATTWFKFYPGDWRADAKLRLCSMGARAMWLEMLLIMEEATPRGLLLVNGDRPSPKQLAMLAGCDSRDALRYLQELEQKGVFSRTSGGTIMSRKMAREGRFSDTQRTRAQKRWESENAGELPLPHDAGDAKETRDQNPDTRIQIADAIWADTPPIAKKRSSKAQLARALQAAGERGKNLAAIRRAVDAYYADPEVCREDHKYAKGVHRVVQADFWETWAEAEGVAHLPSGAGVQDEQFRYWMREWQKDPHKWRTERGPAPDEPGCKIPPEIMAEFGYTPPARGVGAGL